MAKKHLSRRDFMKIAGASAASIPVLSQLGGLSSVFAQETTNIVFGGWGATAEDEGVQAAIEVFEQEYPDIAVEWQLTPDSTQYGQVLLTNFAAGTAPDASFIGSSAYETYRDQGLLLDITDQLMNDPLLGQEDYFIQPQETNRCADDDGRWHGIGSCWVAMQTYHNIDLLAEEGITPPGFLDDELWDWDTLVENTKQLTVDSAGRHPGESGFDSDDIQRWGISMPVRWEMVGGLVHSNGGKFINDEGLIALDSPEALEALQMFQDLIYVHHVMPRTASLESLGMTNTQMLDNGRLAMAVDGSWALSWMNPSMVSINLGTGAIPYIGDPVTMIQAHFHSAISTTEHPEEAWEWVRFLATPFYQTEFLKIGLWLPSQTALTTEEGLATWITEGIHTENYPDFVTSYIPNHGVALRIPAGYVEANSNFIQPAWDALAAGTPAADVFPDAVRQANEIISAAQM